MSMNYLSINLTIPSDNSLPLVRECADPRVPTVDKGIDASPLSWVVSNNEAYNFVYYVSSFWYFTLGARPC